MKMTLPEVHQLVNREQLILILSRSEIHSCVEQINHFKLNGKEVCDVVVNYNTSDPTIKLVLIKQILMNCSVANSEYFIEFIYKTMTTIGNGSHQDYLIVKQLVLAIFKTLINNYSFAKVGVEFIKEHGFWFTHIINLNSSETLLDVCLLNYKFSVDELKYILKNNNNFTVSLCKHGNVNFKDIPECYHDVMIHELNKRKLLGKSL